MRNMEAGKHFAHRGRFENGLGAIGVASEVVAAPWTVADSYQPRNFHRNLPVDDLYLKKIIVMYIVHNMLYFLVEVI